LRNKSLVVIFAIANLRKANELKKI